MDFMHEVFAVALGALFVGVLLITFTSIMITCTVRDIKRVLDGRDGPRR